MSDATESATLDPALLNVLRCPLTHSPLRQESDRLIAEVGGLSYPIRDGIPVMLVEEAALPPGVSSLDELKQRLGIS
ncbi:MAG: Trm112 family protein [Phycisphaerae bacterium]|nr:Trm112 family protein [Phycisphaerae bacterium]